MESEDDFYDDDDVYDSETSQSYDDDDVDEAYCDDYDDDVLREADDDKPVSNLSRVNYTVLGDEEIRQRQEYDISTICSLLSVSRDSAIVLLHRYQWSVTKIHEEWFEDDDKVRRAVGLLEKPLVEYSESEDVICGICFDIYDSDEMHAAVCGHRFCSSCWGGYVGASVWDGPGCLALRCPEPSCSAAVGQDMINRAASKENREKYSNYLFRSYIENYRNTKWCPAPGCDYAVEFDNAAGGSGINYDVVCQCSYGFCWNCSEEAHRPVDCETVSKWVIKNSAESENANWILANSKPCPKCKRAIEKNQGCMHVTCRDPCKFEFCWLCLTDWKGHGERTGGYYSCNNYEKAKQQGLYKESERKREMAKNSLEKYTHYYERWAANNSSRIKALADLEQMETHHLRTLSVKHCQPETQLIFILEAWQQIIECRRVLKWTYAYGYYLPEDQLAKKVFFEYSQGEAEAGLERLHMCAEKALKGFLYSEEPTDGIVKEGSLEPFNDFRTKLTGLTNVTRTYFQNLVQALENGLSDVSNITGNTLAEGWGEGKAGEGQESGNYISDEEYENDVLVQMIALEQEQSNFS